MPTHQPADPPSVERVSSGDRVVDQWIDVFVWPSEREGFMAWWKGTISPLRPSSGPDFTPSMWTYFHRYYVDKQKAEKGKD